MIEMVPLVSIIVPSYNQGRFIEQAILSVLNQDYQNIELIVMDGGSTDETLDLLNKYSGRIIWQSEKDKGQTHAINKGLRLSKGRILAYLNSDDTYLPGAIGRAVRYLTWENPDATFLYGEGYHITAEGKIIDRYPTEPYDFKRLAETCFICQPTTFWKRDVINTIGFFDERLNYAMDYDYWIRIAKRYGKLWYVPEYLANSRFYQDTKTMSKRAEAHAEILDVIMKNYGRHNIPSTWINAYAHVFMNRVVSRDTKLKNIVFIVGITMMAAYKSMQYNRSISWSQVKNWGRWYVDALFHHGVSR